MFKQALPKNTKAILALLEKSEIIQNAYLAGGTALALQLGHLFDNLRIFQEFNNMLLKGAEVIKALNMLVNLFKVNLEIFMSKNITQACHWQNTIRKSRRDNTFWADYKNCFFVVFWSRPVAINDNMVAYV